MFSLEKGLHVNQTDFGTYEDRYTKVFEVFTSVLAERPKSGAALSIWRDGRCVVNLYGGYANESLGIRWGIDTPSVIFSSSKGVMSILAATLFQNNQLDYEIQTKNYWPEYGENDETKALVKHLLSHRAGVPALRDGVTLDQVLNWKYMVDRLASETPYWKPGSNYFYHAITHGWLVGELILRITGKSAGEFLQSQAAIPLGLDCWLGIPESLVGRVAELYVTESLKNFFNNLVIDKTKAGDLLLSALTLGEAFPAVLVGPGIGFNDSRVQKAEIPGAGCISTAYSLAKLWSSTVVETDGVRLLNDATIAVVTSPQSEGPNFADEPGPYSRFGMGFQLDSEARRYLSGGSFGHDGAGGQSSFADPDAKIGFTFLTNEMDGPIDHRATSLIDALRVSLSA